MPDPLLGCVTVFSVGQEKENDFKVTFDNLKHGFFDFIQIAFGAGQEAENKFAALCNHYKIAIFFTQVAFWAGPEAEN